jgi:glycosyltransferase involved in cell wall biosynthesis
MAKSDPKISILLPVFNAEKTLAAAIRSILFQTCGDWELIILDDGSSDNSLQIARSFEDSRIRIISDGRNMKLPSRLNQGIELSRGKFIARMDADDISYPDRLDVQLCFLDANSEIDLVGSRIIIFNDDGNVIGTYPYRQKHSDICIHPWKGFYFPHPTWMGKASWFKSNLYQIDANRMEDQDILLRTYKKSQFECLPVFLLGYRQTRLSLKNILIGRLNLSKSFITHLFDDRPIKTIEGILGQMGKAAIDVFAITTALGYKILRHRAMPVPDDEIDNWNKVWQKCNVK